MKKAISLLLVLVMCAVLAVPAFAEPADASQGLENGAAADPRYEEMRQVMTGPKQKTVAKPTEIVYRKSTPTSFKRYEPESDRVEQVPDDGAPADPHYEEMRQFMVNPDRDKIAVPSEIRFEDRTDRISSFSAGSTYYEMIKGSPNDEHLYPVEQDKGAHYYAFSLCDTKYEGAFANIKLPTGYNNANHARNGFLSLGVHNSITGHALDLGLMNEGDGWFPSYCFNVTQEMGLFRNHKASKDTTNAVISVGPLGNSKVSMYIQYLNASGAETGSFYTEIDLPQGFFTTQSGKPQGGFYRFASLVNMPGAYDNRADGSYMTGGKIQYCQIYDGTQYVPWAINSQTMHSAWKVYPEKIAFSYSGTTDTFNIMHM